MIEVIKQLVDALQTYGDKHRKTYLLEGAWDEEITKGDAAIQAGKQTIAELESQEPVACQYCYNSATLGAVYFDQNCVGCVKRMSHQPQRTWVGLAKEDRLCAKYMQDAPDGIEAVIDYIESKLKELNT
jgi:hypothetical protein